MKKETIKKIMEDNLIVNDQQAEEALNFVRDLIEAEIEHMKKTEPYATNYINKLREASSSIMDLLDTD